LTRRKMNAPTLKPYITETLMYRAFAILLAGSY
jgi:hypothetical protein